MQKIWQTRFRELDEKMREIKAARHDLRQQLIMIGGLVRSKQYENLEAYVNRFIANMDITGPDSYCGHAVIDMLAAYYGSAAKKNGIAFEVRCEADGDMAVADTDLCGLFGNLLENALEACLQAPDGTRFIHAGVVRVGRNLTIRVINTATGPPGHGKRKGYGLYSIRKIARKYNGQDLINWDGQKHIFDHMVVLRA